MPIEARIKSGYFSANPTAFRESSKFTPTLTTLTPAFLIRLITSSRSPSYCEKWRWQCESKSFRVDIKDYYKEGSFSMPASYRTEFMEWLNNKMKGEGLKVRKLADRLFKKFKKEQDDTRKKS